VEYAERLLRLEVSTREATHAKEDGAASKTRWTFATSDGTGTGRVLVRLGGWARCQGIIGEVSVLDGPNLLTSDSERLARICGLRRDFAKVGLVWCNGALQFHRSRERSNVDARVLEGEKGHRWDTFEFQLHAPVAAALLHAVINCTTSNDDCTDI